MISKVVLDTNIVTPFFNQDPVISARLHRVYQIYVPATVVGEIYFGAYNSTRIASNILKIRNWLKGDVLVLRCDTKTGDYFGRISAELAKKAIKIPQNDIWIAAIALQYQLPLVTRDKHFNKITDLEVLKW